MKGVVETNNFPQTGCFAPEVQVVSHRKEKQCIYQKIQ
jgi:hypothetical protein